MINMDNLLVNIQLSFKNYRMFMCWSLLICLGLDIIESADVPSPASSPYQHVATQKTDVQCILDQHPTEVYLKCEPQALINIRAAHVGHQEIPMDTPECVPRVPDSCVINITSMDPLLKACMGMNVCNKVIYNPARDGCQQTVNYVQVEYECIPDNSADPLSIVDICGDIFGETKSVTRKQGHVTSLGYPADYSPQTSCSCNLTTADPSDRIRIKVLDMDLSLEQRITNAHDWLEYTHNLEHWGEGHKLNNVPRHRVLDISGGQVYLNFRTDNLEEGRGFWIQYEALAADGSSATDVKMQCGHYDPPDYKTDITCFQESGIGELYLNCRSQGVINVVSAIRGYQTNMTTQNCAATRNFSCSESAMDDEHLLTSCMGKVVCNPAAKRTKISACGEQSNYMQVAYQCIREKRGGQPSIIDMCGDATMTSVLERTVGYVETLNFPDGYFPNQQCTCRLNTVDDDAQIILSVLDLGLDSRDCKSTKDWMEYIVGSQNWGKGVRLCGSVPGEPIHTGAKKLYTNFYSDASIEGRGVWYKYLSKKSNGELSPIRIICGRYIPGQDLPEYNENESGQGPATVPMDTNRPDNSGLIAGLSFTAILMIIVVIAMIVYRYKRPRKEKQTDNMAPGGPPNSAISRVDTGYGTLKYPGFSTKKDGYGLPYTNLDEERSAHSKDSNLRERTPSISRISGATTALGNARHDPSTWSTSSVTSSEPTSSRSEIAFSNPAFEDNLETTNREDNRRHLKV